MPLLAICRGLQILNVALGGSLHQHLPEVTGHEGHQPAPGVFGAVDVNVAPGTRTAELIGPRLRVSCHHHQALARLAPGLEVTGRAGDGTVEAVEVPGRAFAIGVQWHPEETSQDVRLFAALVDAGQRYRNGSGEQSPPAASTSQPELGWPLAGETGQSQRAIVAGKALAHQAIPTGRKRS